MASPTVAHFLPLLNFVSCNTVRNVPINEKALPIPRNRSMMKNRWIQCPPCGIVPNATGQLPSTRLNDEYHRIARVMILRSHYLCLQRTNFTKWRHTYSSGTLSCPPKKAKWPRVAKTANHAMKLNMLLEIATTLWTRHLIVVENDLSAKDKEFFDETFRRSCLILYQLFIKAGLDTFNSGRYM